MILYAEAANDTLYFTAQSAPEACQPMYFSVYSAPDMYFIVHSASEAYQPTYFPVYAVCFPTVGK